jgi:hypothetical protein
MTHLRCEDDSLHLYRPVIYLARMEANFRWTTTGRRCETLSDVFFFIRIMADIARSFGV